MDPELPPDQSPPAAETDPAVGDARPDHSPPDEPDPAVPDAPPTDDARPDEPVADQPPPSTDARPDEPVAGGWVPTFQVLRSRTDRKLGGVAGGLAAATQLDPALVRFAVVLGCLTGWGILLYLVAWAVIPEEDPVRGRVLMTAPERTGKHLRLGLAVLAGLGVLQVLGAVLGILSSALIGLGLFPFRIFGLTHRRFVPGEALLGLLLLVGGLLLLFRRHLPWVPADGADAGAGPGVGAAFSGGPMSWGAAPAGPAGAATATRAPAPPAPAAPGFGARASAAARAAVTNGPLLLVRAVGWLVGLWFLAAAVLGGLLWLTGAVHLHLPVIPIAAGVAAVGTLGYALLRTRRPAAVIGAMALLLVPAGLGLALGRLDGQAGHRTVTPTAMADLQPVYRHATGLFELDLSRLQLPAGQTTLRLSMGAGKIEVTVPRDADVDATASVGAGTFELFGNRQTGVNLNGRTHSAGQPGAPVLVIRARAGAGDIEVQRPFEPPIPKLTPETTVPTPATEPTPATAPAPPPAPAPPGAPPGQYLCTIPDGGGPATCKPA